MRERVRQFDGQLNIESNESGTKVSVILPLPESYSLLEDSTIEAFPAD
jgi:signal transduction histidine kinase